ncbi:unnamed protein product [Closterium sp. NIES-65]|nr:unnamed protein product [Closterium sp. NIES-65]
MRADLCAHAMGELLRKLDEDGLDVPSQPSGLNTNTTLREGATEGREKEEQRIDQLEAELLSRQQAATVSLVQPSYPVYRMAQSVAVAHPAIVAVPKQETLAGGEDSEEYGEGENEPGTKPTKYAGVYVEADTRKYGVKIVAKDKEGKKITKRVGAYTTIEEAAYCYAAAAHVLRPGKGTRNSVALTPADKAALKGCTPEILKVMVDARMWWRWRVWRETYEGLMLKAARTKKNATRAKRGRPRKGSGDQGGGTAGEGEGEKAGSADIVIAGHEAENSRTRKMARGAEAKSIEDKTDETGRGRPKEGAWDISGK